MAITKKLSFGRKRAKKQRGKFIVVEGIDGSGKTTQAKFLAETLAKYGYDVETIKFPQYGTKSAGMVEEYLNGKYGQVNAQASSIFYAIDRFDASVRIRQWLEEGKFIVCDRYVLTNAAHQGGKIPDRTDRVKFYKWLDNLEYTIFGIPKPDLNIILHVDAKVAQKLVDGHKKGERKYVKGKKRDLHEADLNHLANAEKVYVEIAKLFPNTKLIECMDGPGLLPVNQIHNKVWEMVRRVALKNELPR